MAQAAAAQVVAAPAVGQIDINGKIVTYKQKPDETPAFLFDVFGVKLRKAVGMNICFDG